MNEIQALAADVSNWIPLREVEKRIPSMNYQQIKRTFQKRDTDESLNKCCRKIGHRLFINLAMFGLWMGCQL